MPKSLSTSQSVWTKVFRRIVSQLESNAEFRRVVGRDNLRTWSGNTVIDRAPFEPTSGAPIVRLTPQPGAVQWYSPELQSGILRVHVELGVQSLCVDDVADLWDLIVQSLRPGDAMFTGDLVDMGAETGLIVFSDPAFDPQPQAEPVGYFFARGFFNLTLLRSVL